MENLTENVPVGTSHSGRKPNRRGKASSRNFKDKQRSVISNRVDAEMKQDAFDELLGPMLKGIGNLWVNTVVLPPAQATPKLLPVSTRGIGFNTAAFHNFVLENTDTLFRDFVFNNISAPALYRIHLSFLERALAKTAADAPPSDIDATPMATTARKPFSLLHVQAPSTIGLTIRAFGDFSYNGSQYHAYVPPLHSVDLDQPLDQPSTSGGKRRRNNATRLVPHPFYVTYSNLRDTVEFLSDVTTPRVQRDGFYKFSPLPGAIWTDTEPHGWLLMNPDDFIPANYDAAVHTQLIHTEYTRLMNLVSSSTGLVDSSVTFDKKGDPSQLVCHSGFGSLNLTSVEFQTYGRREQAVLRSEINYKGSSRLRMIAPNLAEMHMHIGAVTCLGEDSNIMSDFEVSAESIRSYDNTDSVRVISWKNMLLEPYSAHE